MFLLLGAILLHGSETQHRTSNRGRLTFEKLRLKLLGKSWHQYTNSALTIAGEGESSEQHGLFGGQLAVTVEEVNENLRLRSVLPYQRWSWG